jgi:hypothetical protein
MTYTLSLSKRDFAPYDLLSGCEQITSDDLWAGDEFPALPTVLAHNASTRKSHSRRRCLGRTVADFLTLSFGRIDGFLHTNSLRADMLSTSWICSDVACHRTSSIFIIRR